MAEGQFNVVAFVERGDGAGLLVRAVPKVDVDTAGTLYWDCDFAFGVGDVEAAVLAKGAVPSARENRARATDGIGSTVVKFRPKNDGIVLSLTAQDGKTILNEVSGEIRGLELRTTEKVQTYVARIRIRAVLAELAGVLCAQLGKRVGIVSVPLQGALPFEKARPTVAVGSVVCAKVQGQGNEVVYGKFTGEKDGVFMVSDFSVIHQGSSIVSAITVANASPGENPELRRYVESVRAPQAPSWRQLVRALGTAIGKGTAVGDELRGWVIDASVVDGALALHGQGTLDDSAPEVAAVWAHSNTTGAVPVPATSVVQPVAALPPEAGSGGKTILRKKKTKDAPVEVSAPAARAQA